jgi:uncharacterized protein
MINHIKDVLNLWCTMKSTIKKQLMLLLAHLSVLLALIGIFLPILPTTPFLLLAAAIYLKHSKRMYRWLMNHELFGYIIYDYWIHRSVQRRHKIIAWLSLWSGIVFSMYLLANIWINGVLFLIATLVSIHIFKLKTRASSQELHTEQKICSRCLSDEHNS